MPVNVSQQFDVTGFGVVVTGGASGLGLAYGEVLASHGARVTLIDVDGERGAGPGLAPAGRRAGRAWSGRRRDRPRGARPRDRPSGRRLRPARRRVCQRRHRPRRRPVRSLVHPPGTDRPRVEEGALERYSDDRWDRVIEINLNGVFATARAAARHMRPRRFGRIIITTSLAATKVEPVIGASYMTAKAGARHFMRTIALELAADGITVNAIAPGFFVTNIGGGHAHDPAEQAAVAKDIPMHRVGFPDDIKALALFLASPASDYITGQEIVIDGGWGLGVGD